MKTLLIGALLLATSLATRAESPPQPEVWRDPDTGTVVVVAKGPPAKDAQDVRDQGAGVLDTLLVQPILPIEFGQTTISGLPGFYMRGVLLAEPEDNGNLATVLYSKTETYILSVTSLEDVDFNYVETHAKISGTPHPVAGEVLVEIVKRLQAGLPEMKRLAVARNRAAVERSRAAMRKDILTLDVVKTKRDDLAPGETNAAVLNQRLHAQKPAKIYGWGAKRLSDTERTVTLIYEAEGKTVMLVWIVNSADQTTTNISTDTNRIETLRANRQLNLPSDKRLMSFNPEYDMTTFRNSDYYRGRGTDPLGRPIE